MSDHAPDGATMHYIYTHTGTEATTGYFSCEPERKLTFDEALEWLEAHPNDDFMHQHLLRRIAAEDIATVATRLEADLTSRPVLGALLREACVLNAHLEPLLSRCATPTSSLMDHTPLVYLAWSQQPDRDLHREWCELFTSNMQEHRMLPLPEDTDLPPLYVDEPRTDLPEVTTVATLHKELSATPAPRWDRPPAHETAARALETLVDNGIIAGVEMRHEASLSPIALLRKWNLDISVRNGVLNHTLAGEATTYGRGLSLADARASYSMEMVERASSYASVGPEGILGLTRSQPLVRARYSELAAQGIDAINPNDFPLEVAYRDQPLHWLEGHTPTPQGNATVLVPAQMVYLFCNLDEHALFTSAGSTGLASGNTMAEAKAAALTEILERDAEATTPYHRERCFTLTTDDERLKLLLDDYAARGIHIQFQDMTTEFGVPCYTCFVTGARGKVTRGTGAGLDGKRAVISAMTETPYPYPGGAATAPALRGLPVRKLEDLPCYTLESPSRNVELLEKLFFANNRRPVYVELTREDLGFPVVKALVPGLELTADFDTYTRVSRRLYRNYLNLHKV